MFDFREFILDIERPNRCIKYIDLSFVGRSLTPKWAIPALYLAGQLEHLLEMGQACDNTETNWQWFVQTVLIFLWESFSLSPYLHILSQIVALTLTEMAVLSRKLLVLLPINRYQHSLTKLDFMKGVLFINDIAVMGYRDPRPD